jgi:acyl-CoA synthetase (AMP-forming)/AMP-acid ligase II
MQAPGSLTRTAPSINDALELVGRRRPDAPALAWRNCVWSYQDLLDAIATVRGLLAYRSRGTRIALLVRNSPQYVALYYGTLAAGCVAVPLNPQERSTVLERQILHSGADVVIGEPEHKEWRTLCTALDARVEMLTATLHDSADCVARFVQELGVSTGTASPAAVDADELAVILYTSGTTGCPKGVMLSHGNILSNAAAIVAYLDLGNEDRGLCVLPFHFSYGSSVLNSHLLAGATLFIEDNLAFPHITLERIQNDAVTGFAGVPSTFALLLGRCRFEDYNLRNLRYVTLAGGPMPRPTIERLQAAIPGVEIVNMYGQTEATARLTYLPPDRLDDKCGSVGIPIDEVEIDIRADGQSVGPNTVGEIHARGPNVMLGYWRDADASARVLNDGWLRTGDLGHVDEAGFLYIDGRTVEMIKVGAFRISPQEVEEVIASLTGVQEVGVTGIPDEILGQSVFAAIVLEPGGKLDARAVKAHCHQRLAAYKIPKKVAFFEELPRTSSGKIQRHKLATKVGL